MSLSLSGREGILCLRVKFTACLKDGKMIYKVCIYDLVRVRDVNFETPNFEFVPIVNMFSEVFQYIIPSIPSQWRIYFSIDLIINTKTIPMLPPYIIVLLTLEDLKEQLKDLLDKGFNPTKYLSVGCSHVFCLKIKMGLLICA